jgi:AraC-like DNA-binding protein
MDNFFKYTTKSSEDKQWGLYINVAGCATIPQNSSYPPEGHPSGYNFNWKNGRVLREYQLNYITNGEGILETKDGNFRIEEGSVIILYPGVWHRYRPLKKGWREHYVGFNGEFADRMFENEFFSDGKPIIKIGFNEELLRHFNEIRQLVKSEKPGYQQICSGLVVCILSSIMSIKKNETFNGKEIERIIQKSCMIIRDNLASNLNMEKLADDLNIGYSNFRKMFKNYTGISPAQYHLSLRIQQAKDLLNNTDLSIKEITYQLGFNSIDYFSRVFKSKTGKTPTDYKTAHIGELSLP